MRLHLPTSRGSFKLRLTLFDSAWAIVAPLIALYFRDANILSVDSLTLALIYCFVSVVFSLVAASAFHIHEGVTAYFSVYDAIKVGKAVAVATLMTYVAIFTLNRLEGVPRSLPVIHALTLLAGLIGIRICMRLFEAKRITPPRRREIAEHILMIGSNRLSLLYVKFIKAYSPGLHRVMAVLDDRPEMLRRAIDGVPVIGPVAQLESVIHEYAEHGIKISQIIVGGDSAMISENILPEVQRICEQHEIKLDFVPELIGLQRFQRADSDFETEGLVDVGVAVPPYFRLKRLIDVFASVVLIAALLPIWLLVALIALLDVGSPIFFWQQRLGQDGRPFLLHKIRTLKPPLDWHGRKLPDNQRLSILGRLLRKCRFDELPQLLNVLVGDMSLIGPRPLLPRDQPPNPAIRLSVRPGITGWAQVNGGHSLCVEEKDALDEWYIRNASLRLDLHIILMTLACIFRGERRSDAAIDAAFAMRRRQCVVPSLEQFLASATQNKTSNPAARVRAARVQTDTPTPAEAVPTT